MDCIKTNAKTQQVELLTHADKIARLEEIFAAYHRKSDVFLPSDAFYAEITGPESLEAMASEIFAYLGMKHRSVEFHVDADTAEPVAYHRHSGTSRIVLGWHALQDPLLAGSLVAHSIIHHLLEARAKINLGTSEETEALTDLATIHSGLGILVMNGIADKRSSLGSMAPANYLAECLDYFKEHRVVPSVWQPYVNPEIIALHGDRPLPKRRYRAIIRKRIDQHARYRKNLMVGSSLTALFLGIIGFAILSGPQYLSAEMQAQKDTIDLLRLQHRECEETVQRKERTWDTSDIFMQRRIDADKTRCTSLRNRYNYEVARYNEQL
jgi:hypothetical protein